jgi:O-antigen ligase
MLPTTDQQKSVWSFRLLVVCLAAVSVSLPMAWISVAKLLVFVLGLVNLITSHWGKRVGSNFEDLWSAPTVIAILLVFSLSMFWTTSEQEVAWLAFVKHGRILEILLLVSLIHTAREARIAIAAFAIGQGLLLLNSWILAAGVPNLWTSSHLVNPNGRYVVFSTYLDQSIIFSATAGVFWHLRSNQIWPRWLGGLFAAAALINVLLLLEGRTGYAVAVSVLSLAAMWKMPSRLRLATLFVTPIVLLTGLYFGSSQVQGRIADIVQESQTHANQAARVSSSGWRLNSWHRSLQAMKAEPWLGYGVGSWTTTVRKIEGKAATQIFGEGKAGNPHQEYLLWGVELGIGGTLLLLAFMGCLVRDALRFERSVAHATISVVAAMAVACLFNSSLYDALIGDYFCVALGLLLALGARTKAAHSAPRSLSPLVQNQKAAA